MKSGAEEWVLVPGESSVRVLGGSMRWWLYTSVPLPCSLRAATSIHHHPWDFAVNDLLLVIEVEHVNGGHLGWRTAGPCGATGVGVLHQVGVRVFLHEHVLALARAIVGFVAFGSNDPVPAERLEIHSQRVATADSVECSSQSRPRFLRERLVVSRTFTSRNGCWNQGEEGQDREKEVVIREQQQQHG